MKNTAQKVLGTLEKQSLFFRTLLLVSVLLLQLMLMSASVALSVVVAFGLMLWPVPIFLLILSITLSIGLTFWEVLVTSSLSDLEPRPVINNDRYSLTYALQINAYMLRLNILAITYILQNLLRAKDLVYMVLPEEARAELSIIYHRLKCSNLPKWKFRCCLTSEILFIYIGLIHIWWDNLFLSKADQKIDD